MLIMGTFIEEVSHGMTLKDSHFIACETRKCWSPTHCKRVVCLNVVSYYCSIPYKILPKTILNSVLRGPELNWFTNFLYRSVSYLRVQASCSIDESEPFSYLFCLQALSLSNRDEARSLIEKGRGGWVGAGVLEIFGIGISTIYGIEISTNF